MLFWVGQGGEALLDLRSPPRQPQGPLQRWGPPASLRLGRTERSEGGVGEQLWAAGLGSHPDRRPPRPRDTGLAQQRSCLASRDPN